MTDIASQDPTNRLTQAFAFAEGIHRGQTRKKTGAPTLSHLLAVTALVLEHGGDEDEAIAALLHDGPEDCAGKRTLDEIRQRFGERVAGIVSGCTDSLTRPRPPWMERKKAYLEHLPETDDSARLVSLADKVHNVRSLVVEYRQAGEALWQRFSATRDDCLWYYYSLLEIFRSLPSPRTAPLVDELDLAIVELQRLTESSEA